MYVTIYNIIYYNIIHSIFHFPVLIFSPLISRFFSFHNLDYEPKRSVSFIILYFRRNFTLKVDLTESSDATRLISSRTSESKFRILEGTWQNWWRPLSWDKDSN